ncbi:MMPL family transporter [Pseudomonas sp. PDM13]|uniref:MMPL family transporter n=1 Tax=Pseudomonas sp. PDM13 TaxID=2769255 RepID=UPI0021DFF02A|nr:MMPL family transporter [Pseudomonas sp. PDM13]MCU9947149.1 MMPL family transporter [Pseudomonas sp. PDM13]
MPRRHVTLRPERLLPRLFLLGLVALLALAAWQWRNGPPVAADMLALLPQGAGDAWVQRAEQRMQEPLNREVLLLVGHTDAGRAQALARQIAERWQGEPRFERVQWSLQADLPALRQQLQDSRLALLPRADRQLLEQAPERFIAQRAERLFDPFSAVALVPAEDDWLGIAGLAQKALVPTSRVQTDLASGALQVQDGDTTWVLLRARTKDGAFDMQAPPWLAGEVAGARQQIEAAGGHLLAASGLLHAAAGQAKAAREISLIGGGASLGTLLLMLVVFRRPRTLLSLLPVGLALGAGCTACVLVFGEINALTLVLGASLTGVAADYPLHYLSKSWTGQPWRAWQAVRDTLPGLSLSLGTNLIGYLALAFTPFPALTQIAVFSAAGLVTAYLCSVCLLPALLGNLRLAPPNAPLRLAERLLACRERLLARTGSLPWLLALLAFCAAGLWQVQPQNDLRQWLGAEPRLLDEAREIARLTGLQPTSQFFLVRGDSQEQMLQRQAELAERLDAAVADGNLQGYRALSQLVAPEAELQALRDALARLPQHWQALLDLGIPTEVLENELNRLRSQPPQTLDAALAGPLGEAWRPLWLGSDDQGRAAGIVSLQGLASPALMADAARGLDGVQLIDRIGELNQLFAATQFSAAELKLASCAAILVLLCIPFGLGGSLRIVALPLLAALASLACLGWLGQPLTLFSLFGLLLITAIGVDYAILMREAVGGAAVSLLGTLLSGMTSWLSFGLLLLSQTPAIANFGLAISLGLFFCFLLAPWAQAAQAHGKEVPA